MEAMILFARDNDDVARAIASNGYEFVRRHLRYKDVKDYWRMLLDRYTSMIEWDVVRDPSLPQVTSSNFRVVDKGS
jgi:protein glucosyltransferase